MPGLRRTSKMAYPQAIILAAAFYVNLGLSASPLPSAVQSVINDLPQKKLTLPFVIAKSYAGSDVMRAIQAQQIALEVPYWQSLTPLSTNVSVSARYVKNQDSQSSFFEPKDSKIYSLNVSRYFTTGTRLAAELNELQSTLQPGNIFQPAERTVARLTLSQNLWRDAFGYATRQQIKAGKQQIESNKISFNQDVENWMLELTGRYYDAWLAKSRLTAAQDNYARQKRLSSVTRLKLNRGTAERPDFLQVESALLQAQTELDLARRSLQNVWSELVMSLKLPEEWMNLPAEHIPLELDQPELSAKGICSSQQNARTSLDRSTEQRLWQSRLEASKSSLAAAKNNKNPELALEGSYQSSGALGEFSERSEDVLTAQNPYWSVGLSLKMPLEFYKENAELALQLSEHERIQALAGKAKSDHTIGWVNNCASLHLLIGNREALERATKNLTERATLEERRFQLGRTATLNVITAGSDLSNTELSLHQNKVQLNRAAWQILRLNGSLKAELETYLKGSP